MLDEALQKVSVLGAAGKMGCGISLLVLQEMVRLEAEQTGEVGSGKFRMMLIDANDSTLHELRQYLRTQTQRYAEKEINRLREYFKNNARLVSNEEMIRYFVKGTMEAIRLETNIEEAKDSNLVFEAITENLDAKARLFSRIDELGEKKAFFFTNTSSIPIGVMAEKSGIKGRLMGLHFYNPPPVQRLLEIIPASNTDATLVHYGEELGKRLGKKVVFSKDIAGFIGNGHFIREIDFACRNVKELEKSYSRTEAIAIVNRITQDFLIRPMGMFQLMDYVGLDVCQKVKSVMSHYLNTPFESALIDDMLEKGVSGGQNPDGSQKPGFFNYQDHAITGIYQDGTYVEIPKDSFGNPPPSHVPWKELQRDKNKNAILETYFHELFQEDSKAAQLAREFLFRSREIARNLVIEGVAHNIDDVNTVMQSGFYHLYGPDNTWIPEETTARSGS